MQIFFIGVFKDSYRILKGKLTEREGYSVPPGTLKEDTSVEFEQYDFNFQTEADEDIQKLISHIYDHDGDSYELIANKFTENLGKLKYKL